MDNPAKPLAVMARLEVSGIEGAKVPRNAERKAEDVAEKRFLTLADVGEVLNISSSQTYALVRSGELPAIQIGGRGQWRVESHILEEFIARAYQKSAAAVRESAVSPARENSTH